MKTYRGKFHISRAMNDRRVPKVVDVHVERHDTGRNVVDITIAEEDVARMLLGSFHVPCEVTDFRDPAPAEVVAAFKAGAAWARHKAKFAMHTDGAYQRAPTRIEWPVEDEVTEAADKFAREELVALSWDPVILAEGPAPKKGKKP